ncbi:MAG: gamma-glutamylcyclotransferase [Bacteroidetes bacterium]|nr:gamma-glutamylcyclotransferase [Bacteroidota bacterium]
MIYYFAYGNNMHPNTVRERCLIGKEKAGVVEEVGIGRIKDHRLAFTVSTPNWGGPVGDIVFEPNFYVYGFLYKIDERALHLLDEAEFVPEHQYYTRNELPIEIVEKENPFNVIDRQTAITYQVIESNRKPEKPPHPKYIQRLIEGAEIRELPRQYVNSLKSMDASIHGAETGHFLGLPTKNRGKDFKMPIIQLSSDNIKKLKIKKFAFVRFGEKTCVAKVRTDDTLISKGGVCRIDESIRRALGFPVLEPGIEFYGGFISIFPAPNSSEPNQLIPARFLLLRMVKVDYLDCEKRIVVMDESLMAILGIEKGDYVQINGIVYDNRTGTYKNKNIQRRAFTGSTKNRREGGELRPYPEEGVVHLDLDAREELGFDKYIEYYPLYVAASTKDLLLGRFVFYILVIVGILVGIQQSVAPLFVSFIEHPDKTTKEIYGLIFSTTISILIGIAIAWNDVARKVKP